MRTAEEISVECGVFNNVDDAMERVGLLVTRDYYRGISENIISAIKLAQKESYNQAIEDATKFSFKYNPYNDSVVLKSDILKLKK